MGQRVICCQVVASYITGDGVVAGAVGSHAGTVIELDFTDAGPEWQDTVRSVTFTDALNQNPVKLLLTPFLVTGQTDVYHIPVPQAAMAVAGTMGMSATGVILDGEKELIRVATELARFRVLPNQDVLWEDADVPATAAEQLQGEIDGILDGTSIDSFGDVETALAGIQDGTDIDSFADVETALGNIQDGVTLDSFGDVETQFSGILDGTDIDSFGDVEDALDDYLPLAGGTMLGNLNMGLNKITNLLVPYADNDAATKKYVDDSYVTAGQKAGTTLGTKATAEGYETAASGDVSHAEGYSTEATDDYAHAEGLGTKASGYASHAEGTDSVASGASAHAEGNSTAASGLYSHAEGHDTKATHKAQHVFGEYNVQDPSPYTGTSRGNYVEIVGNGTGANSRSNARTLDWAGNEVLAGKLTLGAGPSNNMDAATKGYVDGAVGAPELFWCEYGVTTYAEITAALEAGKLPVCVYGDAVYVYSSYVEAALDFRTGYFFYNFETAAEAGSAPDAWLNELQCDENGWLEPLTVPLTGGGGGSYLPLSGGTMTGAIAMGSNKITGVGTPTANGDAATKQYVDGRYVTAGQLSGSTLGDCATAEGAENEASGDYSHAEGFMTVASGGAAHTEGGLMEIGPAFVGSSISVIPAAYQTDEAYIFTGNRETFPWGVQVGTILQHNHVTATVVDVDVLYGAIVLDRTVGTEGCCYPDDPGISFTVVDDANQNTASGSNSHAEGRGTTANHASQHVFGEHNVADPSSNNAKERGNYVEIVGNGVNASNRSNARTLDWSGNEVLAGKLTLGAGPSNSMDAATKGYVDAHSGGSTMVSVTLAAASWVNSTQTVTVTGVLADETKQLIQPVPASASRSAYETAGVKATAQGANSLTFTCDTTPSADLTVYVCITGVSS